MSTLTPVNDQDVRRAFDAQTANLRFFNDHFLDLMKKYAGKFLLLANAGQIEMGFNTLRKAMERCASLAEDQRIGALVEFMDSSPDVLTTT